MQTIHLTSGNLLSFSDVDFVGRLSSCSSWENKDTTSEHLSAKTILLNLAHNAKLKFLKERKDGNNERYKQSLRVAKEEEPARGGPAVPDIPVEVLPKSGAWYFETCHMI